MFLQDDKNFAFEAVERFFQRSHIEERYIDGKKVRKHLSPPSWHCGGPVPKSLLSAPEIPTLLKIDLIPAIDITNTALSFVKSLAKSKYDEHTSMRLIPKVLHACGRRGIPQNYAPGILLLYLEHCESCQWRHFISQLYYLKRRAWLKREELVLAGRHQEALAVPADWTDYMIDQVANLLLAMGKGNEKKQSKSG